MLIDKFKDFRRRKSLNTIHKKGDFFAFIGTGNHSRQNLFPCLHYLGIPLKYIYSRDAWIADMAAQRFPGCQPCTSIDTILMDSSVKGVFICTKASLHFKYALAALQAGKYVFLEKPPCFTVEELEQLHAVGNDKCLIAFQKRYCIINRYLQKFSNPLSYSYQYLAGAYPEGSPLYELFSHAIDNIVFLFGNVKEINIIARTHNNDISYAVNTLHANGVIGNIELSTAYSWENFTDKICINYSNKTVLAEYPGEISVRIKKGKIFSVPIEKIFKGGTETIQLLKAANNAPVLQHNPVYLHGYYDEMRQFIRVVNGNNRANKSAPSMLKETWRILGCFID